MKKLYSTILMLAMMIAALGFVSCGDDDEDDGDSSVLVGTWDAISSRFYNDDGWEETESETGYWVFTETTVTDHFGSDDILNGRTLKYKFDGKHIIIEGYPLWEVLLLTDNTMILKAEIIGGYQETTFKKR